MSSQRTLGLLLVGLLSGLGALACNQRQVDGGNVSIEPSAGSDRSVASIPRPRLDGPPAESAPTSDLREPLEQPREPAATVAHEPPPPTRVPMKGIVLLPEAWGVSRFDMHAELFDPRDGGDRSVDLPGNRILRLDDPRDAWQFSFPAVRPGIYAVTIDPLGWITDVDARGDGIEDAQLQVPPPARVSVRFTQEDSHIPADVQLIQWRYDPIHALSMKVNSLRPTSGTGWFEFVVPSGYIEISVEDDRFAPLVRSELASPRMKEIELPVVRACGFVLRIRNAGVQLPTSPEDVVVSGIDNPNMRTRVRAENLDQRFTVGGPGRYRIGLRPRKEYFPVRSQEIEIPPRRYVDVNFDLECAN